MYVVVFFMNMIHDFSKTACDGKNSDGKNSDEDELENQQLYYSYFL